MLHTFAQLRRTSLLIVSIGILALSCSDDTGTEAPVDAPDASVDASEDAAIEDEDASGDMGSVDMGMPDDMDDSSDMSDSEDVGPDTDCTDCFEPCDYLGVSEGVCGMAMTDQDGVCQAPADYEAEEASCDDGLDNSCDGNTDCGGACDPCDLGELRWALRVTSAESAYFDALTVDSNGDLVAALRFRGDDVDLGDGALSFAGEDDFAIVKFDSDGNLVFAKAYGGTGRERVTALATDSTGGIYAAGWFDGNANFGGSASNSTGTGQDMWVARYDSDGNHVWSQTFGSTQNDTVSGLAVDSNNHLVLSGTLGPFGNLGNGNEQNMRSSVFVVGLDDNGDWVWSKTFSGGAGDSQSIHGMTLDDSDNVYLAGFFNSSISFGGPALDSDSNDGAFHVKLNSTGDHVWSVGYGGAAGPAEGLDVAVDSAGNAYFSSWFQDSVDVAGQTLTDASTGGFIVKYDATGAAQWARHLDFSENGSADSLQVDGHGNVYASGNFRETLSFEGEVLTVGGGALDRDIFVTKLDSDGNLLWLEHVGSTEADEANDLAVDANGTSYIGGFYRGVLQLDGSSTTADGTDALLFSLTP